MTRRKSKRKKGHRPTAFDRRYEAFVENHRYWTECGILTDPLFWEQNRDPADYIWSAIARWGLPEEISQDFKAAEIRHKRKVSHQNAINGALGGKIGGRGRSGEKRVLTSGDRL